MDVRRMSLRLPQIGEIRSNAPPNRSLILQVVLLITNRAPINHNWRCLVKHSSRN